MGLHSTVRAEDARTPPPRSHIGISTYSFWQFKNEAYRDIEKCIDLSAEWGFDGVEILHRQMTNEEPGYLQRLKKRAFVNGLSLCGFSTHQGFVYPDAADRKKNIDHTIHCIELAYQLGIPTMRVNTGRWNTTKSFDDLMKNRGVEPRIEGYTDEDGFKWVIDSLEKCLPAAEKCGVLLGLGGWLVMQGQLTLGQLVAAELIIAVVVGSLAKAGKHFEGYYDLMAAVDKLGHLMDLPLERRDGENLPAISGGVRG